MKLDSVRSAKADIFLKAFGYQEVASSQVANDGDASFSPVDGTEAFDALASARRTKKRDPRELIAVGVVPTGHNGDPGGFELAILVQQKRLLQHPIVEQARRLAFGEARVIFTGPAARLAGAANAGRHRPLRIGSSVSHYRVTAGTLGCFATCRRQGGIGILSNNHVLADTNRARSGDEIIQPGRADGGRRPDHTVARLFRFVPLDFTPNAINFVDCAFATLVDGIEYVSSVPGTEAGANWIIGEPNELLVDQVTVQKWGRTTGHTTGTVTAVSVDNVFVNMIMGDPSKVARFDQQMVITGQDGRFSKPGDSGAVVFEGDRPVGLLFAGTESGGVNGGGIAYANQIGSVLDLLEIDILRS